MIRFLLAFLFALMVAWQPCLAQGQAGSGDKRPVLVVLIFDESCKAWCQKVRPVMKELKDQYGDKVEIIELDASAPTLKDAETRAKAYGVYGFLRDSADWVPIVGIFSGRRKLLKELVGPKQKDVYVAAIDKALRVN
ncbi:MAG TPA: hypothetical protein V6D08_19055 [Candidatus Obscuribacterales bacterium]